MARLQELLEQAGAVLPVLPALIVLAVSMVVWRLAHRLVAAEPGTSRSEFRIQIAHLVIGLVSTLLLLLVIPVDSDLRGQLLTVFGLVLSAAITLASTTFVGNVMAGVMLKTVRNFRRGDFVRVGDNFGRVTERALLSTEIQTEDRDLVTLPNLYLVTNPVKVIRASGTIVSAEVSLGYEVRHEVIESCLAKAAGDAGLIDPFVLVMQLGDFAVVYRANGLLEEVKQLLTVRSRLRVAMLDRLHEAGVEIVSPNFMNQRVLAPETRVLPEEGALAESAPAVAAEEVAVEEIVFDKAEEAATLDQLVAELKRTREAIAELADPPGDAEPETIKRQQEQFARRLVYLESAIAKKEQAVEGDGAEEG